MTGWSYGDLGAMSLADLAFWARQAIEYSDAQAAAITAATAG